MAGLKSFRTRLDKIKQPGLDNHILALFGYQARYNPVYRQYLQELGCRPEQVTAVERIPFMPIEFFKYHEIKTGDWQPQALFRSSGTTGQIRSVHLIDDIAYYHRHAARIFESVFGPLAGRPLLALLPSYLERQDSSLVSMVSYFIDSTGHPDSGFYLDEWDDLVAVLDKLRGQEVILFGVTFALLELADRCRAKWPQVTVIETGGMKGRGEEITREELIEVLQSQLGVGAVYSEYGMTELLSQAYGAGGRFRSPPALRIYIRDSNDPFSLVPPGRTGGINLIDLANVHSCAFIETQDLGRIKADGSFEVLGRFDQADLRGCNLLVL